MLPTRFQRIVFSVSLSISSCLIQAFSFYITTLPLSGIAVINAGVTSNASRMRTTMISGHSNSLNELQSSGQLDYKSNREHSEENATNPTSPNELSTRQILYLFSTFGRQKKWKPVLELLNEAEKLNKMLDIRCYGAAITALSRCKKPQYALEVLNRMIENGIEPNLIIYTSVIDSFAKVGDSSNALAYLSIVEKDPTIQLDVQVYSTVIAALVREDKMQEALRVFCRMKESGVEPNVVTYTTIIDGFAKTGNFIEALKYMKEMFKESKIKVDVQVYNAFLSSLARSSNSQHAVVVLDMMLKRGIKPDLYTYNAVLDAFSKTKDSENTVKYLRIMEQNNIHPDVYSYSIAMKACSNSGDFSQSIELFKEMRRKGIDPDESTTYLCVGACIRTSPKGLGLKKAFQLIFQSGTFNDQSLLIPFTIMIDSCCRSKDYEIGRQTYEVMKKMGVELNVRTKLLLVKLFGDERQSKSASDMLKAMDSKKRKRKWQK